MNDVIKMIVDDIDVDVFASKGLYVNDDLSEKYYTLYKNYKILFEKYLLNKLPLKKTDDEIINSGLHFLPIGNDDMDIYQSLSTMGLKYIYLRNNLYVEKLSLEDVNLLVGLSVHELSNPDDKLFGLIDRTYKSVIDSKKSDDDMIHMNCYGPDSDAFWIDSSELVFGIRCDEFGDNGLGDGKEWEENYYKQLELLGKLINEMNTSCSDTLGLKVNFLYYDDISVKKSMIR